MNLLSVSEGPILLDGAMATHLWNLGFSSKFLPDLATLTAPDLVTQIHRSFLEVKSMILLSNTFGASRQVLKEQGLSASFVGQINQAAVNLLKRLKEQHDFIIAGCLGPVKPRHKKISLNAPTFFFLYEEQMDFLVQAGVDCLWLETQNNLLEIEQALKAAEQFPLPCVLSLCLPELPMEKITPFLASLIQKIPPNLKAIGFNCHNTPQSLIDPLKQLKKLTDIPLIAKPNAGLPVKTSQGHWVYPLNPKDWTQACRHLIEMGVNFIGGCCGTTAEHLRSLSSLL